MKFDRYLLQRRRAVLLLVLMLSVCGFSSASHFPADAPELEVYFDQEHGTHFFNQVNLTGTSNLPLRNTTWSIVNISGQTPITVLSGPFLTTVSPIADGLYSWTLLVSVDGVSCTCYVELETQNTHHQVQSFSLILYIGQTHQRPVLWQELHSFAMGAPMSAEDLILQDEKEIVLGISIPNEEETNLKVFAEVCEAPFEVCLTTPNHLDLDYSLFDDELRLQMSPEILKIQEGIWNVDLKVQDEYLRTTGLIRIRIIHDSTPPIVNLSLQSRIIEHEPFDVYAEIHDGYIGSTSVITWKLFKLGSQSRLLSNEEVINNKHVILNLSSQGQYTIEASVRDIAGNTAKYTEVFEVENLPPVSRILVDGLLVADGATITVGPNTNWSINGSLSSDNEPFEYLWVIDDATSMRGVSVLLSQHFTSVGLHKIELIVFDDDGSTNSSSLFVNILGAEKAETPTSHISLVVTAILITTIFVSLAFFFRPKEQEETALPKWNPTSYSKQDESSSLVSSLDATVEEETARG